MPKITHSDREDYRKDGGKDRILYRLYAASRIADNGSNENYVIDYIDPAVIWIDPGVAVRTVKAKVSFQRDDGEIVSVNRPYLSEKGASSFNV